MDWDKVKLGGWSAAGGAVLAMIVGFNWGGWVTGGTADVLAKEIAENAVAKRFTPSCVARFEPGREERREAQRDGGEELSDDKSSSKSRVAATLPEKKDLDSKVAEGCAKSLMEVKSLNFATHSARSQSASRMNISNREFKWATKAKRIKTSTRSKANPAANSGKNCAGEANRTVPKTKWGYLYHPHLLQSSIRLLT